MPTRVTSQSSLTGTALVVRKGVCTVSHEACKRGGKWGSIALCCAVQPSDPLGRIEENNTPSFFREGCVWYPSISTGKLRGTEKLRRTELQRAWILGGCEAPCFFNFTLFLLFFLMEWTDRERERTVFFLFFFSLRWLTYELSMYIRQA